MSAAPQPPSGYKLCPKCRQIYSTGPAGAADSGLCPADKSELVADERIFAGKFILQSRIDAGAGSEVYVAEQPQLGRRVALKLLPTDPQLLRELDSEVRAIGTVQHEHVVTLYDSGRSEDGRPYLAMEYLEGEDLAKHLARSGAMNSERALVLWRQAVSAIAAAHRRGIVHGDLKPRHLFLTHRESADGPEEIIKVLAFRIAKRVTPMTADPIVRGATTDSYAAPEQRRKGEATPRSDVYSLGLLLLAMLHGRLDSPTDEPAPPTAAMLRQLAKGKPGSGQRPWSAPLQELLSESLHPEPLRRPADAAALLQLAKQVPELVAQLPASAERSQEREPEHAAAISGAETPRMGVDVLNELLRQIKERETHSVRPVSLSGYLAVRIAIAVLVLGGVGGVLAIYARQKGQSLTTLVALLRGGQPTGPGPLDRPVPPAGVVAPVADLALPAAPPDLTVHAESPDLAAMASGAPLSPDLGAARDGGGEDKTDAGAEPGISVLFVYGEADAVTTIECAQESEVVQRGPDKRGTGVQARVRPGGACRVSGPFGGKTYKYDHLLQKHPDAAGLRRVHVRLRSLPSPPSPTPDDG